MPSPSPRSSSPLHAASTGIVLPAGIPVRIVGSGLITKTQTPGAQEFCANYPTTCNGDYQRLILGPALPVYGDTSWFGDWRGAASLSWNGAADAISFGLGNHVIEMTWPGGEMWAGHAYWECYYQDYATMSEQAPCFGIGGAWTIAVVPNDGSENIHLTV